MSLFAELEPIEAGPVVEGPPPLPAVSPAWLPPLCDANTEEAVYRWHRLVWDGHSDLDPEECGHDAWGGPPEWLLHEDDTSLDTVMSPEWTHTKFEGHDFPDKWLKWALHHGISPGQPFLVRIGKPHYSYSYWDNECDVEWDVEVVRVMPKTLASARRSWERILARIRRYYAYFIARRNRLRHLQDTDSSALSLKTESFFADRYDEMSPPGGLRIILCSAHSQMWGPSKPSKAWPVHLVSGEDRDGDYQKAFRNLLSNIEKYRPAVDLQAVLALAGGRAKITRWEHLNLNLNDG